MANQEGNKKIRVIVVLNGEFKQGMNGNICEASTESWVLLLNGSLENLLHGEILR